MTVKLDGTQNALILADGTGQALKIKVSTTNVAWTLTLPTTAGTAGQVLETDGAGNTQWVTCGGGGGVPGLPLNSVQFNNGGAFAGDVGLTYANGPKTLTIGSNAGGGSLQIYNTIGTFSTTISAGSSTANLTLKLPPNAGAFGYVLTTDGSGNLSWTTSAASIPLGDDTTTATDEYPIFSATAGGVGINLTQAYTASTEYTFNPLSGNLTSPHMVSSSGIALNSNTIATSYTIPAGFNGLSAGTLTFAAGAVVTVNPPDSWVIV
jgi:hypothetical protein